MAKKSQTTIRLSEAERDALGRLCQRHGLSMSSMLAQLVRAAAQEQGAWAGVTQKRKLTGVPRIG